MRRKNCCLDSYQTLVMSKLMTDRFTADSSCGLRTYLIIVLILDFKAVPITMKYTFTFYFFTKLWYSGNASNLIYKLCLFCRYLFSKNFIEKKIHFDNGSSIHKPRIEVSSYFHSMVLSLYKSLINSIRLC